jgi:tetratricopeptide (TPR) repeat protein
MFSGARGGGGGDDAAGPDAHLSDLFSRLHQSVEDRAHKRASKLCDEILKVSPGDVDASRAKVVALVESARYADAVAFLERSDDAELKASLAFEHAYALYRSHRLEEALAMVAPSGSSPAAPREHRVAQLEAQLLYRLGRPAEAADAYERVLGSSPDGGGAAITTTANLVAALVASRRHADVAQALRRRDVSPKASFEIAFNVACGLIAQREFEDARAYLALAKAQGDAALRDEGLAPEEIAEEMLPAECASALCAAALGARDEAARGYLGVLGFTLHDDAGTNAGTNVNAGTNANANTNVNAGGTNVNAGSHHSRDHATLAVAATNLAALLGRARFARRRVPAPRREALRRGRRFARGRLGARRVRDDARCGGAQPRGGARARQPARAGQRDARRRQVAPRRRRRRRRARRGGGDARAQAARRARRAPSRRAGRARGRRRRRRARRTADARAAPREFR